MKYIAFNFCKPDVIFEFATVKEAIEWFVTDSKTNLDDYLSLIEMVTNKELNNDLHTFQFMLDDSYTRLKVNKYSIFIF